MLKTLASWFFNLHLRRGVPAVTIDHPGILDDLAPVFACAEALGFANPIIRGGALRDRLQGDDINDYDLYVSRLQVVDGWKLPSIKARDATNFYRNWLSSRVSHLDEQAHTARVTERPYLSFNIRFAGIDRPVDLVINDECLSPEMLAVEADATMNAVAASRHSIVAHPLFLSDMQNHIYRPTCATVGNLVSAPLRYWLKFAPRDPQLKFRPF